MGRPAWGGGGKGRDREKQGIVSGVLPFVSGSESETFGWVLGRVF